MAEQVQIHITKDNAITHCTQAVALGHDLLMSESSLPAA